MNTLDFSSADLGYDIVVIGGGAAGSSFLSELSPNFKTLLVDYHEFPRFKACSGIIVREAHDILTELKVDKTVFLAPEVLDFSYLDWDNGLEKKIEKGFWNSQRKKLDEWLLSLSKGKDFDFLPKAKLVDFHFTKNKEFIVLVLESNGEVKTIVTKYLVGCDGALSTVRKKLIRKEIPYYVAIQELLKTDVTVDRAYFIYDDEVTDFYSWIIPKGEFVEIGSAVKPYKSMEKYGLFKKKVADKFGIRGNGKIESAIVLRPKSLNDIFLGSGNVLLCGEAAGLISPSSAEGISYAVRSGKICAEVLNKNYKGKPLEEYKRLMVSVLKRLSQKFAKSLLISDKGKRKALFK